MAKPLVESQFYPYVSSSVLSEHLHMPATVHRYTERQSGCRAPKGESPFGVTHAVLVMETAFFFNGFKNCVYI